MIQRIQLGPPRPKPAPMKGPIKIVQIGKEPEVKIEWIDDYRAILRYRHGKTLDR